MMCLQRRRLSSPVYSDSDRSNRCASAAVSSSVPGFVELLEGGVQRGNVGLTQYGNVLYGEGVNVEVITDLGALSSSDEVGG